MKNLPTQLDDLPVEILLIILKKISKIQVLNSLIGVNRRLNTIVHDSIFTNHLILARLVPSHLVIMESVSRHFCYPLFDPILNRFCFQILPRIHHQIKWLDLEPLSMERVFRAANYPNLCGFGLYNVDGEGVIQLFSGKIFHDDSSTDK